MPAGYPAWGREEEGVGGGRLRRRKPSPPDALKQTALRAPLIRGAVEERSPDRTPSYLLGLRIGHYEWNRERTERICPTPEGAVTWDLLSNIRYPAGVLAWNYNAKRSKGGKGRGKGGCKGGRGGRGSGSPGGRGRGGNSAYEVQDEAATPDVSEATAAMTNTVVDDDDFWT